MMSDAAMVALFAAIPPTVVAFVGLVVSLLNHSKATAISASVDGTASEMKKEIAILREEVKVLVASRAEKKEEAALLAQRTVSDIALALKTDPPGPLK